MVGDGRAPRGPADKAEGWLRTAEGQNELAHGAAIGGEESPLQQAAYARRKDRLPVDQETIDQANKAPTRTASRQELDLTAQRQAKHPEGLVNPVVLDEKAEKKADKDKDRSTQTSPSLDARAPQEGSTPRPPNTSGNSPVKVGGADNNTRTLQDTNVPTGGKRVEEPTRSERLEGQGIPPSFPPYAPGAPGLNKGGEKVEPTIPPGFPPVIPPGGPSRLPVVPGDPGPYRPMDHQTKSEPADIKPGSQQVRSFPEQPHQSPSVPVESRERFGGNAELRFNEKPAVSAAERKSNQDTIPPAQSSRDKQASAGSETSHSEGPKHLKEAVNVKSGKRLSADSPAEPKVSEKQQSSFAGENKHRSNDPVDRAGRQALVSMANAAGEVARASQTKADPVKPAGTSQSDASTASNSAKQTPAKLVHESPHAGETPAAAKQANAVRYEGQSQATRDNQNQVSDLRSSRSGHVAGASDRTEKQEPVDVRTPEERQHGRREQADRQPNGKEHGERQPSGRDTNTGERHPGGRDTSTGARQPEVRDPGRSDVTDKIGGGGGGGKGGIRPETGDKFGDVPGRPQGKGVDAGPKIEGGKGGRPIDVPIITPPGMPGMEVGRGIRWPGRQPETNSGTGTGGRTDRGDRVAGVGGKSADSPSDKVKGDPRSIPADKVGTAQGTGPKDGVTRIGGKGVDIPVVLPPGVPGRGMVEGLVSGGKKTEVTDGRGGQRGELGVRGGTDPSSRIGGVKGQEEVRGDGKSRPGSANQNTATDIGGLILTPSRRPADAATTISNLAPGKISDVATRLLTDKQTGTKGDPPTTFTIKQTVRTPEHSGASVDARVAASQLLQPALLPNNVQRLTSTGDGLRSTASVANAPVFFRGDSSVDLRQESLARTVPLFGNRSTGFAETLTPFAVGHAPALPGQLPLAARVQFPLPEVHAKPTGELQATTPISNPSAEVVPAQKPLSPEQAKIANPTLLAETESHETRTGPQVPGTPVHRAVGPGAGRSEFEEKSAAPLPLEVDQNNERLAPEPLAEKNSESTPQLVAEAQDDFAIDGEDEIVVVRKPKLRMLGYNYEQIGETDDQDDEEQAKVYIVQPGDTLESIAIKTLGDVVLALLLLELNREIIPTVIANDRAAMDLRPGLALVLPTGGQIQQFKISLVKGISSMFTYAVQPGTPEEEIDLWKNSLPCSE